MLTLSTILKACRNMGVYGEARPHRRNLGGDPRRPAMPVAVGHAERGWVRRWDGHKGAYVYVKTDTPA